MNYKSIPPIIGCALLTIYSLAAQPQVQSIQGHRMARTADSDAPSPIPKIDGVSIVRDGVYRITDTRPMEQASKLLERKLGVSVWYEDPVWLSTETWYKPPIYQRIENLQRRIQAGAGLSYHGKARLT